MNTIRKEPLSFVKGEKIAVLAEGAAETAIIDLLLEADLLLFRREDLIEEEVLRIRKASVFETRYLRMKYKNGLSIIRVLDSHNEKFKLSEVYKRQVRVINVVTAPEIEMLVILAEGNYQDYKKTKKKPSEYCKENLKMKNVKSPEFIKEYFRDYKKLTAALCEYRRVTKPKANEYSAADLLKSNWDQHFIMGK